MYFMHGLWDQKNGIEPRVCRYDANCPLYSTICSVSQKFETLPLVSEPLAKKREPVCSLERRLTNAQWNIFCNANRMRQGEDFFPEIVHLRNIPH